MSRISHVIPRQPVPALSVETVGGGRWTLAEQTPESFSLIVVYRGLHCPICKPYLRDLERRLDDLAALGVEVIAISSDDEERARNTVQDWGLDRLAIGYGLDFDTAREWGLYISSGIGKTSAGVEEPDLFVEPGLFLVRPDGTLYFASVQTMPFARPRFEDVVPAIKMVRERDYPARGEVLDHTVAAAAE